MTAILRKYGEATTINFSLFEVDGINFRVDAVHAAGDSSIMKDEGAEANTASGFVDEGNGYSLALSATEMQAARIVIYLVDQTATKVWLDRVVIIETYGNVSAQHGFDLGSNMGVTKNEAFSNFEFNMVLSSDHYTAATGLTVTGERSIDGGAFAAVSGTITEVSDGLYQFDALAADTNGDVVTWKFSSATADDTFITLSTRS